MASERFQRRIDRLLDQVEEAADQRDWQTVHHLVQDVLVLDPGNADATNFLAAAERALGSTSPSPNPPSPSTPLSSPVQPTSFANGRNEVSSSEQRLAYNFDATFPFSVKHPLHFRAVFNFWPDLTPGA